MAKKSSDILVKGNELIAFIKQQIREGNIRRLIIKNRHGKKVLEVPLTAGVGIGGLLLISTPLVVALGSLAAWAAEFRIEIIRDDAEQETQED